MEKCKFFMTVLRVTQKAYGAYSHAGSLAIDFGGKDGGIDPVYAPCDIEIKRVRLNATGEVYVQSLEPVLFADGTSDYLHGIFIHGDNRKLQEGQIIKQGDKFYSEGGWGAGKPTTFANHVHVEAGKGKFKQLTQTKNPQGTYVIENQFLLEKLFWLGQDVQVVEGAGYNWKVDDEPKPPEINDKNLTPEQKDFLNIIGPFATADQEKSGILASLTVAQAILESGWGSAGLAKISNNLFSIKGEYQGAYVDYPTKEWKNGGYVNVTQRFKKYPSWAESLADHSALFLRVSLYSNLIGERDYKAACKKVKADGYATAPDYTEKLIAIIERYNLTAYDLAPEMGSGGEKAEIPLEIVTEIPPEIVTEAPPVV